MNFLPNKYTRIYYAIVNNAKARNPLTCYTERHHVIPRSLGGNNAKSNLVDLTAREHFICHWLLTKMIEGKAKKKMWLALSKMLSFSSTHKDNRYVPASRVYQRVREQCSLMASGKNNHMYGKTHSKEIRKKISDKVRASYARNPIREHSEETKLKISKANKGLKRSEQFRKECTIRNKLNKTGGDKNSGKRWYNDGVKSYLKQDCPEGCVPGRLPLK